MFRRYPYWGWLLVAVALWLAATVRYASHNSAQSPPRMVKAISKTLSKQEAGFSQFLKDRTTIHRIFTDSLSEKEVLRLTALPYYIYAYEGDALVFWNTNTVLEGCLPATGPQGELLINEKGVFIKRCVQPPGMQAQQKLVVLFPVFIRYPFDNNYLRSYFVAGEHIPASAEVFRVPTAGSVAVRDAEGKAAFYIRFQEDAAQRWMPDNWMVGLLLAALLVTIAWLQLLTVNINRKRSKLSAVALTIIGIIFLRWLTYQFGLPFNLQSLPIFSPQLYATSAFLPSLGDLLINALCAIWIIGLLLRYTPFRIFERLRLDGRVRYGIAVAVTALLMVCVSGIINIISSLVVDSRISFDVSQFYSITSYTIVGLFTIGIIIGIFCMTIYFFNAQLRSLVRNKWIRYAIVAAVGVVMILLFMRPEDYRFYLVLLLWLVLFTLLLDIKRLALVTDLFAPHMILWAVLVCILCAGVLQYFNIRKERETRKTFAERIIQQRDDVMEFAFRNITQNIQKDKVLHSFFDSPSPAGRQAVEERFEYLYLGGQLNRYQSRVLLYDQYGNALFNNDTTSYRHLTHQVAEALPNGNLYYKEYAQDGHYYLAMIAIPRDSLGGVKGFIFIDLAVKQAPNETVYPELLQPGYIKNIQSEAGYAYGIYVKNKLITQTNDYAFPVYQRIDSFTTPFTFFSQEGESTLWYKAGNAKAVTVVRNTNVLIDSITLFSYLFGVLMVIALVIVLYRVYLSYFIQSRLVGKAFNFTLRKRIHFSMLGLVFLSFLIIGIVTINFFTYQYQESNKDKLRALMQVVERSTHRYLKAQDALHDNRSFWTETATNSFKYFIGNLAASQKIDINIYDANGSLSATSQEDIYNKSLLARLMRSDAYHALYKQGRSLLIQDETIGNLTYLSSYVPISDEQGVTLGYVNVPFFASEKELNYQISNILVALINLYAFIFLISGLLTVFITQWLTRTFNIIIGQFGRLNLQRNERIQWPYDDEIGLLVKEYNKMVNKVEENAILLAQNEREMAWREMARQVAHEIKNPLTPMKLNIQYLQQALKKDVPNIKELTDRLSASLIEQIDNLSYIASEFSNFAKMPDARPEHVELNQLLVKATELYMNEPNAQVSFTRPEQAYNVYTDRSQLLRVFTNLLENAVQAIPQYRTGTILVTIKEADGYVTITIADNGKGIDAATVEKIFQPYFTTKSSGTGLGLAMTKKIIEFWNGRIWFETAEDVGTTFFIRLPLVSPEAEA